MRAWTLVIYFLHQDILWRFILWYYRFGHGYCSMETIFVGIWIPAPAYPQNPQTIIDPQNTMISQYFKVCLNYKPHIICLTYQPSIQCYVFQRLWLTAHNKVDVSEYKYKFEYTNTPLTWDWMLYFCSRWFDMLQWNGPIFFFIQLH